MTIPTLNDIQAVDPVLTNILVGYKQADTRFVASKVFPAVPVDKDSVFPTRVGVDRATRAPGLTLWQFSPHAWGWTAV